MQLYLNEQPGSCLRGRHVSPLCCTLTQSSYSPWITAEGFTFEEAIDKKNPQLSTLIFCPYIYTLLLYWEVADDPSLDGNIQGQVGWDSEQPDLIEGVPAYFREFGLGPLKVPSKPNYSNFLWCPTPALLRSWVRSQLGILFIQSCLKSVSHKMSLSKSAAKSKRHLWILST